LVSFVLRFKQCHQQSGPKFFYWHQQYVEYFMLFVVTCVQ